MPTATNPIPNSKGVSTILSLFSSCFFDILKYARPLSPSPHAVTSVITPPKSGPSLASTALLAAGVIVGIGVIGLILARAFAYLFSKPNPPKVDLTQRNIQVITPPPSAPTNGSAPLTPPLNSNQPAPATPPLPPSAPTNGSAPLTPPLNSNQPAPATPPLPPSAPTNGSAPLTSPLNSNQPPATPPPPPSAPTNGSAPLTPPLNSNQPPATPPPPPSAPTNGSVPLTPPDSKPSVPAVVKRKKITLSAPRLIVQDDNLVTPPSSNSNPSAQVTLPNAQVSALQPSLIASPGTITNRSNSASTSPPTPMQPASTVSKVYETFTNAVAITKNVITTTASFVCDSRHFSKWTKYRLIQNELEKFAHYRNIKHYKPEKNDSEATIEIANAWNKLVTALREPNPYTTADNQYRHTITCLREAYQKLVSATAEVQKNFVLPLNFVKELSYVRFAGIKIFPYCRQLIELASKTQLPTQLTLENFLQELKMRTEILNSPDPSYGMNGAAREKNKTEGSLGLNFDPLLNTSDIPFQDGEICIKGKRLRLLWHGTPVSHHDPLGLGFEVVSGILKYIPLVNKIIPNKNPVSSLPVINADYIAFIEEAAKRKQNILHVVLESGEKSIADESGRVKARLRLGIRHENMFVMALRLDGKFFERHDIHNPVESIQSLKKRLRDQLLMPLIQAKDLSASTAQDLTASTLENKQMEDQLAANGFYIPQKLRDASKLPENIDALLNEIHKIYFLGVEHITSTEQHQAFLMLSYVHIMLFIIIKCRISILEALCKNDKDRGNVIKTLFKLHYLYLTGKINHETLTSVFVYTLARPFILQKNAIIKSRLVLLERAIPVINAAHKRKAAPETLLFPFPDKHNKKKFYYRVAQPKGQTIYPSNAASKTREEYLAFVEYHNPAPTHCNILKGVEISNVSQLDVGRALKESLSKIYDNQLLKISINFDEDLLRTNGCGITFTLQNNTSKIKFTGIYNITDGKKAVIARVKVSMTMADDRSGQAQFTCVKLRL